MLVYLKNTLTGTSESKTTIILVDQKFGKTPKTNLGKAKEVGQSVLVFTALHILYIIQ
jgi:hypothetical protein